MLTKGSGGPALIAEGPGGPGLLPEGPGGLAHPRTCGDGASGPSALEGEAQAPVLITPARSEEHTSELQSRGHLVCRLLLEKKKKNNRYLSFDYVKIHII